MGLYMIAKLKDTDNRIEGYRLFDEETGVIKAISCKSLIAGLKSGIAMVNLEIVGEEVKGVNGSLDRYAEVPSGTLNNINKPIIVLGKYSNEEFKVVNCDGRVFDVNRGTLVNYVSSYGIANGKLVEVDGVKFISSIVGEYTEIKKVTEQPYLAVLDYTCAKGGVDKCNSCIVYDTKNKVLLNRTWLARHFSSLGYTDNELMLSLYEGKDKYFYDYHPEVMKVPRMAVLLHGSTNSMYRQDMEVVLGRDLSNDKEVMYKTINIRNVIKVTPLYEILNRVGDEFFPVRVDCFKSNGKAIIRSATDEIEYSEKYIKEIMEGVKNKYADILEDKDSLKLMGVDAFEITNTGILVGVNRKPKISVYEIPSTVVKLADDWLCGISSDSDVTITGGTNVKSFEGSAVNKYRYVNMSIRTSNNIVVDSIVKALKGRDRTTAPKMLKATVSSTCSDESLALLALNCETLEMIDKVTLFSDRVEKILKAAIKHRLVSLSTDKLKLNLKAKSSLRAEEGRVFKDALTSSSVSIRIHPSAFIVYSSLKRTRDAEDSIKRLINLKGISDRCETIIDKCIAEGMTKIEWAKEILKDGEDNFTDFKAVIGEPLRVLHSEVSEWKWEERKSTYKVYKQTYRLFTCMYNTRVWLLVEMKRLKNNSDVRSGCGEYWRIETDANINKFSVKK